MGWHRFLKIEPFVSSEDLEVIWRTMSSFVLSSRNQMSNMQNSWVLQGKGIHTLTYTTWVFSYRRMVPDLTKPAETYEEPTALVLAWTHLQSRTG